MSVQIGPFGSVTVFGGATVDRIAATSAPPVEGASNPGVVRVTAGGVGFNLAAVLARFGRPVRLVTSVGADDDGRRVLAAARDAGIDMSATRVSTDAPTATYQAALDNRGGLIIGIADMRIFDGIDAAAVDAAIADAPKDDFWVVDANLPRATLDFIVSPCRAIGTGRRGPHRLAGKGGKTHASSSPPDPSDHQPPRGAGARRQKRRGRSTFRWKRLPRISRHA